MGGASIIWKALVQAYDLIGTGLVWRVGSGSRVRLGMDPWVGSSRSHLLPEVRSSSSSSGIWILLISGTRAGWGVTSWN